jgi:predicted nucleic acid-binding protein
VILVDSTVWIEWLRTRVEPHRILAPWIQTRAAAICGVVRVEVLRGVICAEQKARLEDLFDLLDDIPTDARAWVEATNLAWQLDRRGLVIPLSDLVIATCARRVQATVVTTDRHFSHIPGLAVRTSLPQTLQA